VDGFSNLDRMVNHNQDISVKNPNAEAFEVLFTWLGEVIHARLQQHFDNKEMSNIELPNISDDFEGAYIIGFLKHYETDADELIALLLALAPNIYPSVLDAFFVGSEEGQRGFSEMGGIKGKQHGGFLPTGETVLFLLAGADLERRFEVQMLLEPLHYFSIHNIARLETAPPFEPRWAGQWVADETMISVFTTGDVAPPQYSKDFPAQLLRSKLKWDGLVLPDATLSSLNELLAWVEHGETLLNDWGLGSFLKPGYRTLFYGPPGTGKTLTATLIGKKTGKEVYRIDLASVVSKYIGETEKNLERVFSKLDSTNAILFFDEADSLFGKRTNVRDAHDRYANQEVSYLLQRVEEYNGLVILASNFNSNIDEAFLRRFQAIINFPMPDAEARKRLWQQMLPPQIQVEKCVNLDNLSQRYELAGGAITNVIRYACLMALQKRTNILLERDLIDGIKRELIKEGKSV
jgi:ATPase family associated with various cellular activities (AAA)